MAKTPTKKPTVKKTVATQTRLPKKFGDLLPPDSPPVPPTPPTCCDALCMGGVAKGSLVYCNGQTMAVLAPPANDATLKFDVTGGGGIYWSNV